jgi:hypothetical protein
MPFSINSYPNSDPPKNSVPSPDPMIVSLMLARLADCVLTNCRLVTNVFWHIHGLLSFLYPPVPKHERNQLDLFSHSRAIKSENRFYLIGPQSDYLRVQKVRLR